MTSFQGYIQIYTGDGKGKTTAALGLALRCLGAGYNVLICQFLKKGEFSEVKAIKECFGSKAILLQFGSGRFVRGKPSGADRERVQKGLEEIKRLVLNSNYRLVVLDEINVALNLGLADVQDVLEIIEACGRNQEWVLTGRGAPSELMDAADLVTEMHNKKHYFQQGVKARIGIEK